MSMQEVLDRISSEIYQNSYVVIDDFVDDAFRKSLLAEQNELLNQGKFRHAAIGKGDQKQVRTEIRSDEVLWMDAQSLSPLQAAYWEKVEGIRHALNRRCFLGLTSFEGHFARYPPRLFLQAPLGSISCGAPPRGFDHFIPKRYLDRSRWGTTTNVFSPRRRY